MAGLLNRDGRQRCGKQREDDNGAARLAAAALETAGGFMKLRPEGVDSAHHRRVALTTPFQALRKKLLSNSPRNAPAA